MKKIVLVIAALLVILFFAVGNSVNTEVWNSLKNDRQKCRSVVKAQTASGLIQKIERTDRGDTRLVVNELLWQMIDYDVKISTGVFAYCVNAPEDGRHDVFVYGSKSGKILGHVANGNWFSN